MSGAWLVETSVVTFWLMSVQLTVCSFTLAPGLADSKRPIRSRQNFSVFAEYSGTSSEISPSTAPEAEPSPDSSSSEPPQAASAIAQNAAASAAVTLVHFLMCPLSPGHERPSFYPAPPLGGASRPSFYPAPSLCGASSTIERLRWGGRSGSNPRALASPTAT